MAKSKATGKHYVSKGERNNVSKSTRKLNYDDDATKYRRRVLNQLAAAEKGRKTKLTADDTKLMGQYLIKQDG